MKPAPLGTLNADAAPIEGRSGHAHRCDFRALPSAFRLTVQDSALPEELRSMALERELVVSDIGVYPFLNAEQCEQIYNEIAVVLLDFLLERPGGKDMLRAGPSSAPCTRKSGSEPDFFSQL